MLSLAEYIWIDGTAPTRQVRSKAKILDLGGKEPTIESFPGWSFDGSSTNQAEGNFSDCLLEPVCFIPDPIRGPGNYLVLCEVFAVDGAPHVSNSRARLRAILDAGGAEEDPWFGFEQEYTMYEAGRPLGWPADGYPGPQGPYYCSVGADKAFGREVVETHTRLCMDCGLMIYGINAEVMPGQWEFQIGYRGIDGESADALTMGDHLWLGRWLLDRVAEDFGITISYVPKPVKGDWNGAGKHTNFSTRAMRSPETGKAAIESAIKNLETKHSEHIPLYGHGLEERLTGAHETCHISQFRSGNSDRGASIRIPPQVAQNGYGYIEDRRPAANADPYEVAAKIIETVCEITVPASVRKKAA